MLIIHFKGWIDVHATLSGVCSYASAFAHGTLVLAIIWQLNITDHKQFNIFC